MILRLATIDDREAIARVHCASWEAAFTPIAPELVKARGDEFPRRYQTWGEILSNKRTFTYVAVENGQILGFGEGGTVRKELGISDSDGELHRLYVAPDKKGRGIGKKLINQVANTLKKQGKKSLVVVAWSINEPAKAIYQHLGAKFVKELKQEKDGFDNSQTIYLWQDINVVIEATL